MGESTTNSGGLASSAAQGPKREPEPCLLWPKKKQRAVRDQIRRVIVELEGILHGLKEVHLEMKEVVQQIDHLTSAIDLTEDEPHTGLHSDTLGSSSSSGVMVGGKAEGDDSGDVESGRANSAPSSQKSVPSVTSSPVSSSTVANSAEDHRSPSPNDPSSSDSPPANQSTDPKTKTRKEGMTPAIFKAATLGPRGKKPPPYPHHKTARADNERDGLKAPPYPVKRRLLSTTV
ncbi:inhibitory synaptic factor 1 [Clupea harengus]|uniref:Inhibitory synaptic factor 1 n=1 Tax=Clupea harengus TaxID=7950 RepID=A0A6P8G4Z4_CLUHA|nr:inhibitory synaptic factor 1 [Clupea harengus]